MLLVSNIQLIVVFVCVVLAASFIIKYTKTRTIGYLILFIALILLAFGFGIAWIKHVAPTQQSTGQQQGGTGSNCSDQTVPSTTIVDDKLNTSGPEVPIIFTRNGNLYAIRLDGAAPVPLTNTGYNRVTYYLPQEGKLLFIRSKGASDVTGDVMSIDFATGQQTILLPASILGSPGFLGYVWAALSPVDGKLIVTEGDEAFGGSSLHSASPDGKDLSPSITGYIPAASCAFNPDGSGLAFENKHTDVRATLIYNLVWNKTPVPLITSTDNDDNALQAGDFAWRPDGRAITFFGYTLLPTGGQKNGIYEVTTGGSVSSLYPTPGKWINGLHWLSADRLAFIAMPNEPNGGPGPDNTGSADYYVFNVPTGKTSLLMSSTYSQGEPQWSWNPNRTAFVFQKEWQGSLWVKDLSNGVEKEIAGTEGVDPYRFTWGSDPFSGRH